MLVIRETLRRRRQLEEQPRSCQVAGSSPRKSCIHAIRERCARFRRSVRIRISQEVSRTARASGSSAHLLSVCCAPGGVLGPGEAVTGKVDVLPALRKFAAWRERQAAPEQLQSASLLPEGKVKANRTRAYSCPAPLPWRVFPFSFGHLTFTSCTYYFR